MKKTIHGFACWEGQRFGSNIKYRVLLENDELNFYKIGKQTIGDAVRVGLNERNRKLTTPEIIKAVIGSSILFLGVHIYLLISYLFDSTESLQKEIMESGKWAIIFLTIALVGIIILSIIKNRRYKNKLVREKEYEVGSKKIQQNIAKNEIQKITYNSNWVPARFRIGENGSGYIKIYLHNEQNLTYYIEKPTIIEDIKEYLIVHGLGEQKNLG